MNKVQRDLYAAITSRGKHSNGDSSSGVAALREHESISSALKSLQHSYSSAGIVKQHNRLTASGLIEHAVSPSSYRAKTEVLNDKSTNKRDQNSIGVAASTSSLSFQRNLLSVVSNQSLKKQQQNHLKSPKIDHLRQKDNMSQISRDLQLYESVLMDGMNEINRSQQQQQQQGIASATNSVQIQKNPIILPPILKSGQVGIAEHQPITNTSNTQSEGGSHLEQFKVNHVRGNDGTSGTNVDQAISQGVEELRQLRLKRKMHKKIKRLEMISRRLDEEKLKQEIITDDSKEDNLSCASSFSGLSSLSSQTGSQISESDSLFDRLDEISVSDIGDLQQMNSHEQGEGQEQLEETIDNRRSDGMKQSHLVSIGILPTKHKKNKTQLLTSILEENNQAGQCCCQQDVLGSSQTVAADRMCCEGNCMKSKLNKKTLSDHSGGAPVSEVRWQSSYNRSYNSKFNSLNQSGGYLPDINSLRIERPMYRPDPVCAQDYSSTFKKDYQVPVDPDFKKVNYDSRIPPSPFYNLSSYKANFFDWKVDPQSRSEMIQQKHKTVLGTPLLGSSSMKQHYQQFSGEFTKTDLAKPRDQKPLPNFSVPQRYFIGGNEKESIQPVDKIIENDLSHAKQNMTKEEMKEIYRKKIEKYKKKLQNEIQLMEAK